MLVCILVCVPLFVCVVLSKGVCVPAMHVYELSLSPAVSTAAEWAAQIMCSAQQWQQSAAAVAE